jgi:hypothetical protein
MVIESPTVVGRSSTMTRVPAARVVPSPGPSQTKPPGTVENIDIARIFDGIAALLEIRERTRSGSAPTAPRRARSRAPRH